MDIRAFVTFVNETQAMSVNEKRPIICGGVAHAQTSYSGIVLQAVASSNPDFISCDITLESKASVFDDSKPLFINLE